MSSKNQSGKGDKYRTFSTETFSTNYDSINWGHPKRKKHNGKQDSIINRGEKTRTNRKNFGGTEKNE